MLDFDEVDERIIEDTAGGGNHGDLLNDYLINYDNITREASTEGIPEIDTIGRTNNKKAY